MSAAEFGDPRLPERFWAKVAVNEGTGCWEWTGTRISRGYGQFWLSGRMRLAHRVAYYLVVAGDIPEHVRGGLQLDHLCRVRACCNPAHLEPVSQRENILRGVGVTADRSRRTHCPAGHELAGDNLEPSALRRGAGRKCVTCGRARTAAGNDLNRAARIALGVTWSDYGATFGYSRTTAEAILAAVESGIAPEVIVANARAAHGAIRAESVDAWIAALRPAGQLALEVSA